MKYIKGNLIDLAEQGKFDIIVHGCNCFQNMGSGIAKEIRARYPEAYDADINYSAKGDRHKLGNFSKSFIQKENIKYFYKTEFFIINMYTQFHYGKGGMHVDYDAIRNGFHKLKCQSDLYFKSEHYRVGIPKIGAGLAGGDWDIIESIIDKVGFEDITCVLFE